MTTRSKRFRYVALAVFLSIGASMMWALPFGLSFSIVNTKVSSARGRYEALVFTHDGTPIIQLLNHDGEVVHYRTLDGEPVEISHSNLLPKSFLSGPEDPQQPFCHPTWSQRIMKLYGGYGPVNWFFVIDDNLHCHGYIVGYDKASKAKIGYLGRNGFRPDEPPQEEQFPFDGRTISERGIYSLILHGFDSVKQLKTAGLLTEEGLVQINLKERTTKLLWKEPELISAAIGFCPQTDLEPALDVMSNTETTRDHKPDRVLVRTPDRVLALDVTATAKEIQTYLLPEKLRKGNLTLLPLPDGKALVQKDHHGKQSKLFWIDTTGKILKQKNVNFCRRPGYSQATESLLASFFFPSIGLHGGMLFCYPWAPAETDSLGYGAALSSAFQVLWPGLLLTGILGVVLAILCYRRQRKYGLEWTWFWTGFVLLLGLPGFFGYLAHRRWPARLKCPSCGELAPRDREACCSCNQNFPEPSPKGTEVFA